MVGGVDDEGRLIVVRMMLSKALFLLFKRLEFLVWLLLSTYEANQVFDLH